MNRCRVAGVALSLIVATTALVACDQGGSTGATQAVSPPRSTSTEAEPAQTEPLSDSPRAYDGKPVRLAAELGPDEIQVAECPLSPVNGEGKAVAAWRSTDGVTIAYRLAGDPGLLTCDASPSNGELAACGGAYTRFADDPAHLEASGGALHICGGETPDARGFLWIAIPEGARWVLVDHGDFWAGYRAAPSRIVRVSVDRGFGQGPSVTVRVAYFGKEGQPLDERDVHGVVAG
jgi:hypothetical protein